MNNTQPYTIRTTEHDLIPARDAERVLEEEFPELHLFIHRDKKKSDAWMVSEASTGLKILDNPEPTQEEAIQAAKTMVEQWGLEGFKAQIEHVKEKLK